MFEGLYMKGKVRLLRTAGKLEHTLPNSEHPVETAHCLLR